MNLDYAKLALLTDLYQLTMAYGYWKEGRAEQRVAFHLFFRKPPFGGGYTVAAGMGPAIEYLENFRFDESDIDYLAGLTGNDGEPLFEQGFLDYLLELRFQCDVDMVREGTVVFPHEPLVRVCGPILQAQLIETALLNLVNFQSLIATKAARVVGAASGDVVLEFGLRRAQGVDGALGASRAAYIGGVSATSNVLAGKLYGIPVRGTHAHSWVMLFGDEREAFEAYARALPNNVVFLVDTYNTLEGVWHAVEVGRQLKARGHRLVGIRLDSGDLAWLSQQAREILDQEGFEDTAIVASNDLDEYLIQQLKSVQGAKITVWGVGTKLVTAYDQPALGGVYKLAAVQNEAGEWEPRVKLSEQVVKVSNPGILAVRRFRRDGEFAGDMIYDELHPVEDGDIIVDPKDHTRRRRFGEEYQVEELLVPAFEAGHRVYPEEGLEAVRERVRAQVAGFHEGVRRLENPHEYPVGLEQGLFERKSALVLQARGFQG